MMPCFRARSLRVLLLLARLLRAGGIPDAGWQAPAPHYISGVFAKYARLAAQADDGAVTNSKAGLVRP